MSACICQQKSSGFSLPVNYPTLSVKDAGDYGVEGDPVKLFGEHGYFIVRGLLTLEEVESVKAEISDIVSKSYAKWVETGIDGNDWEEVANRKPAWKEGKWKPSSDSAADVELGFRRLYRMTLESQLFDKLSRHEKGVWIALDPANCANGCMHILPQPHNEDGKFYRHAADVDFHIDYSMVDKPNPDNVVSVVLEPGDALFFHGHLAHYTPPNVTDTRRRSVQFHYASSECRTIKCPREGGVSGEQGRYFDCDPECQEQKYFYYKKGESLVSGRDYGEGYI